MRSIDLIKGFFFSVIVFTLVFVLYFRENISFASNKKVMDNIENTVYMYLDNGGVVTIRLLPDVAPKHVARFKELVKSKFYDGLKFHRVIDSFMAQTGDPTGTGTGGSGTKILAEFSKKYSHKRKVVSMARANDINSADSQFFIVLKDSPYLDGQYTIFGYVTKGMEYVDKIKKGDPKQNGLVKNPDKIIKLILASDMK